MTALKLLAIAAMSITMLTSAQATPVLHKEIIGTWCEPTVDEAKNETSYHWGYGKPCKDEQHLIVEPRSYHGLEYTCRVTSVRMGFDPSIIRNTKEWGVRLASVTADCKGLDDECWKEQVTFYQTKSRLVVRPGDNSPTTCRKS
jgi:hypothetical protein